MKKITSFIITFLIAVITLVVQLILMLPCIIIKMLTDKDISGTLIKPYQILLDKIPQDYFTDAHYRLIYGFPKHIKN